MAAPLKNIYNDAFFKEFNNIAKGAVEGWNGAAFNKKVKNDLWEKMELKQRMRHLSTCLQQSLHGNFVKQMPQVLKLVNGIQQNTTLQYSGLVYMFIADYVEQYGLQHMDRSFKAMENISMITSCEFAIRPFLLADQNRVMQQMLLWSKHPHQQLRRFASEGCRPRLPWAMAIPALKKDPSPILPILENLKTDTSLYVQKSVANNINDISKDHPELVLDIAENWKGKNASTDWIIKHGCRGLLKSGNSRALYLFGNSTNVKAEILHVTINKNKVVIGGDIMFGFQLQLNENAPKKIRLEYFIYFQKASKKQQKKIFKIGESIYEPDKPYTFSKKHSFKNLTTRTHYAGTHTISIVVNGVEKAAVSFQLIP